MVTPNLPSPPAAVPSPPSPPLPPPAPPLPKERRWGGTHPRQPPGASAPAARAAARGGRAAQQRRRRRDGMGIGPRGGRDRGWRRRAKAQGAVKIEARTLGPAGG